MPSPLRAVVSVLAVVLAAVVAVEPAAVEAAVAVAARGVDDPHVEHGVGHHPAPRALPVDREPDDPALVFNRDGSTVTFDQEMKRKAVAYLLGTDANPSGTGGARP